MADQGWKSDPESEVRCWEQVQVLKEQCKVYEAVINEGHHFDASGDPSTIITKSQLDEITTQRDAYKTRIQTLEEKVNSLHSVADQEIRELERRVEAQVEEFSNERNALKEKIEGDGGYLGQIKVLQNMLLDPMEAKENLFDRLAEAKREAEEHVQAEKALARKYRLKFLQADEKLGEAKFMLTWKIESADKIRAEQLRLQVRLDYLEEKGIDTRHPDDIAEAEKRALSQGDQRGSGASGENYDIDASSQQGLDGIEQIPTPIRDAIPLLLDAITEQKAAGSEPTTPKDTDSIHTRFARWILALQRRTQVIDRADVSAAENLFAPRQRNCNDLSLVEALQWFRNVIRSYQPTGQIQLNIAPQSLLLDYLLEQYELYLTGDLMIIECGDRGMLAKAYRELFSWFKHDPALGHGVKSTDRMSFEYQNDDLDRMPLDDDDEPRESRSVSDLKHKLQDCREELARVKDKLKRLQEDDEAAKSRSAFPSPSDEPDSEKEKLLAELKKYKEERDENLHTLPPTKFGLEESLTDEVNRLLQKVESLEKVEEKLLAEQAASTFEITLWKGKFQDVLKAQKYPATQLNPEVELLREEAEKRLADRAVLESDISLWKRKHQEAVRLQDELTVQLDRADVKPDASGFTIGDRLKGTYKDLVQLHRDLIAKASQSLRERDEALDKDLQTSKALDATKQELDATKEELKTTQKALATKPSGAGELAALKVQLGKVVETLHQRITERDEAIRSHSERTAERNGARTRIAILEQSAAEQNKKIDTLQKQVDHLKQEISNVTNERDVAFADFSALQESVNRAKIDAGTQANNSGEGEGEDKGEGPWAALLDAKMRLREVEGERDRYKEKLEGMKGKGKEKAEDDDSKDDCDDKLEKARAEKDVALFEVHMLRSKESEREKKRRELEERLAQAEARAERLETHLRNRHRQESQAPIIPAEEDLRERLSHALQERDAALFQDEELQDRLAATLTEIKRLGGNPPPEPGHTHHRHHRHRHARPHNVPNPAHAVDDSRPAVPEPSNEVYERLLQVVEERNAALLQDEQLGEKLANAIAERDAALKEVARLQAEGQVGLVAKKRKTAPKEKKGKEKGRSRPKKVVQDPTYKDVHDGGDDDDDDLILAPAPAFVAPLASVSPAPASLAPLQRSRRATRNPAPNYSGGSGGGKKRKATATADRDGGSAAKKGKIG